jgi:hypothetical protein
MGLTCPSLLGGIGQKGGGGGMSSSLSSSPVSRRGGGGVCARKDRSSSVGSVLFDCDLLCTQAINTMIVVMGV